MVWLHQRSEDAPTLVDIASECESVNPHLGYGSTTDRTSVSSVHGAVWCACGQWVTSPYGNGEMVVRIHPSIPGETEGGYDQSLLGLYRLGSGLLNPDHPTPYSFPSKKVCDMRRLMVSLSGIALMVAALSTAGCAALDPCSGLAAPTSAEISSQQNGGDVEKMGKWNTECDLEETLFNGWDWVADTE